MPSSTRLRSWDAHHGPCGPPKWGNANPLRVRICFYPTGGGKECTKYKSFVKSDVGKWRVLATDVIPGTKYRISMDYASHVFKGKLAD
ncbi:hypothetical protein [Streptomyces sp. NPDC053720]|uniref:hypothetical protein n=1 Tax=Streptomyces sp. NPDC053720 TaxID=3154855 RepID=UPI00342A76B7